MAIDYALAHADAVAALVLVAPAVSGAPGAEYSDGPIGALMAALEEAEGADDLDRMNLLEAHMWLDRAGKAAQGRVGGEARELFLDMNGRALRAQPTGEEVGSSDAYSRLGELAMMPGLVVCGDRDFPHPPSKRRARICASAIPQVEFAEMEGTAHLPSLEQAEAVRRDSCGASSIGTGSETCAVFPAAREAQARRAGVSGAARRGRLTRQNGRGGGTAAPRRARRRARARRSARAARGRPPRPPRERASRRSSASCRPS